MEGAPVWGPTAPSCYSELREGIYRVRCRGRHANPRDARSTGRKARAESLWPQFLPDGRHFLYMATAADADGRQRDASRVQSRRSIPPTSAAGANAFARRVRAARPPAVRSGRRAPGASVRYGHVPTHREPIQIADEVGYYRTLGNGAFTVSDNGVLAYQGGRKSVLARLVRPPRQASESSWQAENFGSVRISPDGQRVAVDIADPGSGRPTSGSTTWPAVRRCDSRPSSPIRVRLCGRRTGARRVPLGTSRWRNSESLHKDIGTGDEERALVESGTRPRCHPRTGRRTASGSPTSERTRQTSWDLWLMPLAGER